MPLQRKLTLVATAALLTTLVPAVGAAPASAATSSFSCDGYANPTTRPIRQGQVDTPWSYLWNPQAGTYTVCLDGPKGTNLDLTLERWDTDLARWVDVATATSPGPDEILTYTDTIGSSALYSVYVTGVRGSGDYTLAFNHTPS